MSEQKQHPQAGQEAEQERPQAETADSQGTVDEVEDELAALRAALSEADAELTRQREGVLRMQAEMENLRKRLIRDLERSRARALESFIQDLLPVHDSLERGLEAADGAATVESLREGKLLIIRMLDKVMQDHGLETLDPLGEPFNPELHEAISMQPSDDYPENTVMLVVQKGFRLNERLVRPARVVVSQGPAGN